jgi:hypothetical protein
LRRIKSRIRQKGSKDLIRFKVSDYYLIDLDSAVYEEVDEDIPEAEYQ